MSLNPNIGLHLRINETLPHLVQRAIDLHIATFQFFLVNQNDDRYLALTPQDKLFFIRHRALFKNIFIHSSYWINPAAAQPSVFAHSKRLLRRELERARTLEVPYLVLHPGSAKGHEATDSDPDGKLAGIQTVARMLNEVLKSENDVKILLENTAHGKRTIGNDLEDFVRIKKLLAYPEKVGFCFDTAHAFSHGYSIDTTLIKLLDQTIGLDSIKLIHFNDTYDTQGSNMDRHAFPGKGKIGKETLGTFLSHPKLRKLPWVIEAPEDDPEHQKELLVEISSW